MPFDHLSFACEDQTEMGSLTASHDAFMQRPVFHRLVSLPPAEPRAADNGTKEVVDLVAEPGCEVALPTTTAPAAISY
jgi:hypothetical protein